MRLFFEVERGKGHELFLIFEKEGQGLFSVFEKEGQEHFAMVEKGRGQGLFGGSKKNQKPSPGTP